MKSLQPTQGDKSMQLFASRVGLWPLALALVALGAGADAERPTTGPSAPIKPNLAVGDVITVTNTLGNGAFGSLMWAVYLAANGGETIRFDPSIAGDTIFMENTLVVPKYVTIEGPADKGITISGRKAVRVMDIRQGATLRNLNIKNGYHPTMAAGILSYGPLRLENTSVFRNRSELDMAGIFVGTGATLVNSTVTLNESPAGVAGISYPYNGKLALINSTVAMNYPGRGLMPHGAIVGGPQVTLSNSIVAGNGDLANKLNCYDAVGFIYVGRNMSDDQSCGSSAQ